MSKKASPTLIGGFVVGAAALAVAGILIFGSGKFLADETMYVMYFDRSVKGLDVGAPVVFRGVPIGSVTDIKAIWKPQIKDVRIPVQVAIMRGTVQGDEGELEELKPDEMLATLINDWGLRAQLTVDSLVTGKLYVSLDFLPDTPKNFHSSGKMPEIPTVATNFEQFTKKLENLRIDDLVNNANTTIETINKILESDDVKGILDSLDEGLKKVREVVKQVGVEIDPLSKSAQGALDQGRETLATADKFIKEDVAKLVDNVNEEVQPLSRSVQETLSEAKSTLANASALLSDRSGLRLQIGTVLEELAGAARSIRVLVQYLERHPEALLRGKELR